MDVTPSFKTLSNRRLKSLDVDYLEGLFNIKFANAHSELIPNAFPSINQTKCSCRNPNEHISNYRIIENPEASEFERCTICRNLFTEKCTECQANSFQIACQVIASRSCEHQFHYHCIKRWLVKHDVCCICSKEWLITNEEKILVNFNDTFISIETTGKDKKILIKAIFDHFNVDSNKYVLIKNGSIVDLEDDKVKIERGTYALCTPDCHAGNAIQLLLCHGTIEKKLYAKFNQTVRDLKNEIAVLFGFFSEKLRLNIGDAEITADFDSLNLYNIGLLNQSKLIINNDAVVYYSCKMHENYAIIYPNCESTVVSTTEKQKLTTVLQGRQSWNPYPYIGGVTIRDMSGLLSALYVLATKVNSLESSVTAVATKFSKLLEVYKMATFPSNSLALFLKLDPSFDDMHRMILAVTFHDLINAMRMSVLSDKTSELINSNILVDILMTPLEASLINWDFAKRAMRKQRTFSIFNPIAISTTQPPVLTINENKEVVVYIGKGKDVGSPAVLFNPLNNTETSVNLAELGKKLSDMDVLIEDDRILDEAIIVCIDTSNSMSSDSDFAEDIKAKKKDKAAALKVYYNIWDEMNFKSDVYNLQPEQRRKLYNAVIWFVTHPNYSDWRHNQNCLRQIVVIEKEEYPEIATYISEYRYIFKRLLEKCHVYLGGFKFDVNNSGNIKPILPELAFKIKSDDGEIKYEAKQDSNIFDVIYYLHAYYGYNPNRYHLKANISDWNPINPNVLLAKLTNGIHLIWKNDKQLTIKIHEGFKKNIRLQRVMEVKHSTKVKNLIYKFNRYEYDQCLVYRDCEENGDNFFSGQKLSYSSILTEDLDLHFFNVPAALHGAHRRNYMTRLDIVKKSFDAYVDRSIAYGFNTAIGLMSFGDTSNNICDITAYYESFRDKVNSLKTDGDTRLYDCIDEAATKLVSWQKADPERRSKAKLRIICLSDGADTKSQNDNVSSITKKLIERNITFDAIVIGKDFDKSLIGLSSKTQGYIFNPSSIKHALDIMELEAMVISTNRKPIDRYFSTMTERSIPPILVPNESIRKPAMSPSKVETYINSTSIMAAIAHEYKLILTEPHPDIDVYVNSDDMSFWKVIFKGPESTPYAAGCWLAYMRFPADYPMSPPELRFDTPIRHCNINCYGRVCHSIFDRNYVPTIRVKMILECVYGLLLNPDVSDPLDTNLAMQFYDGNGQYEATIMEEVKASATRTRGEWRKLFNE